MKLARQRVNFATKTGQKRLIFNLLSASFQGPDDNSINGVLGSPYVELGSLNINDSTALYNINNNELEREDTIYLSYNDPEIHSAEFSNQIGIAAYARVKIWDARRSNGFLGFDSDINASSTDLMYFTQYYNNFRAQNVDDRKAWGQINGVYTSKPTICEQLIVSRFPGAFYFKRFIGESKWTLSHVNETQTAANIRWRFNDVNRPLKFQQIGVTTRLPSNFRDRFGIVTSRKPTTVDNDTATSKADAQIYHTITAQTGITQELIVRQTDDNNCWIIRMDQANSTIKIIEKSSGTETERASTSHTWTSGTTYRVWAELDRYAIRVYVNTTFKVEYNNARSNFMATGVKVSHAGSELQCFPLFVDLYTGTSTVDKGILFIGDSKTVGSGDDTNTYPQYENGFAARTRDLLTSSTGLVWNEFPLRDGRNSYGVNYGTTGSLKFTSVINDDFASRYHGTNWIIFSLGVNDSANLSGNEAQWVTDYQYLLDTAHVFEPNAKIGIVKPWRRGSDSLWDSIGDTYIPQVISGRNWAHVVADERVILKADDDGASHTVDGIHPNPDGHIALAQAIANSIQSIGL